MEGLLLVLDKYSIQYCPVSIAAEVRSNCRMEREILIEFYET